MRLSKGITVVLLISFSLTSKAQQLLGFEAGVSRNFLKTNGPSQVSTRVDAKNGYYFASRIQFRLGHIIAIETMPGLIEKNYSVSRTDSLAGIYTDHSNKYLQIPLTLHAVIGKRLKFFLDAGIFGGYWVNSKINGTVPDIFSVNSDKNQHGQEFNLVPYSQNYSFDKQKDQRFDFGYIGGLGLQFNFFQQLDGFIAGRYFYAISNRQKNNPAYDMGSYNQTTTVSLGITYNLAKRK